MATTQPAQKAMRNLANETAAAKALRDTLASITSDCEAIRDTIEGETSLHETITHVMALIRDDEMLADGIDRMQETLAARKKRLQDRIGYYRAAIEQAMQIGEIPTLMTPRCGTIWTMKAAAPATLPARLPAIESSPTPS